MTRRIREERTGTPAIRRRRSNRVPRHGGRRLFDQLDQRTDANGPLRRIVGPGLAAYSLTRTMREPSPLARSSMRPGLTVSPT